MLSPDQIVRDSQAHFVAEPHGSDEIEKRSRPNTFDAERSLGRPSIEQLEQQVDRLSELVVELLIKNEQLRQAQLSEKATTS